MWGCLWGRSSHLPYKDALLLFACLKGQAWGGDRGLSEVAWRHQGGKGHSRATAITGGPSRVRGAAFSSCRSHELWGWKGVSAVVRGPPCSPSTNSPRPTRCTGRVSLGQAGGGGCTWRGFGSAGIWLPADGGAAAEDHCREGARHRPLPSPPAPWPSPRSLCRPHCRLHLPHHFHHPPCPLPHLRCPTLIMHTL